VLDVGRHQRQVRSLTPIQRASVAASWSTAVVGSSRPWPTSSGPLTLTEGSWPWKRPPRTAPPTRKWWLPQPWSLPSPLLVSVRPKSLAVKP
jgi:hypothetical protein